MTQGQTVQRHFGVVPSLVEVAVQASWNQGDVQLSITSPSGRMIDRTTDAPDVLHPGGGFSQTLVVKHPETGQWSFQLFGAIVPAAGEQVNVGVTEIAPSTPISYVGLTPDKGVAPLTVQFDSGGAVGTDGATLASYRWDFGDCSAPASLPNPSHVFTAAGSYTVSLTVTDSNGLSDTAYHDVVVTAFNHPPTAGFLWGLLDPSQPLQVSFDGETSKDIDGKITSYAWNFGDEGSGSGVIPVHPYAKAGTYRVVLTITDDGGLTASICQLVTTGVSLGTPTACP